MRKVRPRWLTTPCRFKRRRWRVTVSRLAPIMSARIWWVSGRVPSTGPAGKRAAGEAWPRPRARSEIGEEVQAAFLKAEPSAFR